MVRAKRFKTRGTRRGSDGEKEQTDSGSSGRQVGFKAQQAAFLLPFLGERFSTRDIIYEGKESGERGWVTWARQSWKQTAKDPLQPRLAPPRGYPGRGRPRAVTSGSVPRGRGARRGLGTQPRAEGGHRERPGAP